MYVFKMLENLVDKKVKRMVYYGLMNPILEYGCIAWGGLYNNHLELLNITQRKILKIMFNKPWDYPTTELFT